MSTTQETADTETGVETITEDTLVPLRIGGSGSGFCGMVTLKRSRATVLELEIDSISDRLICSLCAKSMDYDF